MSTLTPLFLLNTVLMPGGVLPLRVFESRYLDMLARCMRDQQPFAVVAIESGDEVRQQHGEAAQPMAMGTLATISDWDQGNDGLLHVVASGGQRVRLLSSRQQDDGLAVAELEPLPVEQALSLPADLGYLAQGLERLLEQLGVPYSGLQRHPDDAVWVSNRLTEVLPMSLEGKQALLEMPDPLARMAVLDDWVQSQR